MSIEGDDRKALEYLATYNHVGVPEMAFHLSSTEDYAREVMVRLTRRRLARKVAAGDIIHVRYSRFWAITERGLESLDVARLPVRQAVYGVLTTEWATTGEVSKLVKSTGGAVRSSLVRMYRAGEIRRKGSRNTGYSYALLEE